MSAINVLRRISIRWRVLAAVFLLIFALTAVYHVRLSTLQRGLLETSNDDDLLMSAIQVSRVYGGPFHDRIFDGEKLSVDAHRKIVIALGEYAQAVKLRYVYTMIEQDGRIVFPVGSDTLENVRKGTYDKFLAPYLRPPDALKACFRDGRIRFAEYEDNYGTFRSVFLSLQTPKGRRYVVGADISLAFIARERSRMFYRSVATGAAIFVVAFLLTMLLVNRIVKPINTVSEYAKTLSEHDFAPPSASMQSLMARLQQTRRDEVGILADSIVHMQDALQQYIQSLQRLHSIERELEIARHIQESIVPQVFPAFPDRQEFDLYGAMITAREVGGDFYDFFLIGEDRLGLVIADVSDKGIAAALFMAVSRTLMRATAMMGFSPDQCLTQVNNLLARENANAMFVTLFYAILDTRTGHVEYSDGGHNPPLILRQNGDVSFLDKVGGMALGWLEGAVYRPGSFELAPGDALFLYTDGVTEAMDPARELFSEHRLEASLKQVPPSDLRELVEQVNAAVRAHADTAEQSDDITILAVRYDGP